MLLEDCHEAAVMVRTHILHVVVIVNTQENGFLLAASQD